MWSITSAALLAASFISAVAAQTPTTSSSVLLIPTPTATVAARDLTAIGCFSDSAPLDNHGPGEFQTDGTCQQICLGLGKKVMAIVAGSDCYCGDLYPRADSKVDDGQCDSPCNGFGDKKCGGANTWFVWQTGLVRGTIENYDPASESSSAVSSPTQASTPTAKSAETVMITESSSPDEKPAAGPNKAGIAAGVVVGIVAVAAIVGGVILFLKRRKRLAVEQEYQRNAAMKDFYGKPPGTGHSSLTDNRLDPEIMMRRQSNGSIADNQDFSRRVLQIRNPDA